MKLAPFVHLLLMAVLAPTGSRAQAGEELNNLNRVHIVIEKLGPDEKNLGLTPDDLQAVALAALKHDVPSLKFGETGPMLYVQIIALKTSCGYFADVRVKVERLAAILDDNGKPAAKGTAITVWDERNLLAGRPDEMVSRINEKIRSLITRFAADYYRQNER